jgi:hypothetical protein
MTLKSGLFEKVGDDALLLRVENLGEREEEAIIRADDRFRHPDTAVCGFKPNQRRKKRLFGTHYGVQYQHARWVRIYVSFLRF